MRKCLQLGFLSLFLVSCGSSTVHTAKEKTVEVISSKARAGAVKLFECRSGDPIYADVKEKLTALFKIQSEKSVENQVFVSSASVNKGVGDSLCSGAVSLALPYLIKLGDEKLMPDSWASDGCGFSNVGEDLKEVAIKLCGG